MSISFSQRSHYRRSASAMFAGAPFFVPPPAPSGRPADWGWGRRDRSLPLTGTPTLRTLSNIVKKRGDHRWDHLSRSGSLLLRSLVKQFDRQPGRLRESGRSLWRVAWTVLADTSWSWASFMTLSWRSFSISAAIPAMDTVTVRFFWSAAAAGFSPISPLDIRL